MYIQLPELDHLIDPTSWHQFPEPDRTTIWNISFKLPEPDLLGNRSIDYNYVNMITSFTWISLIKSPELVHILTWNISGYLFEVVQVLVQVQVFYL